MDSNLVVKISAHASGIPVFCIPSAGTTFLSYVKLARTMKSKCPVYAFDTIAAMETCDSGSGIGDIAAAFIAEIRAIQATRPFYLIGHCWGGIVALEMAAQMEAEGRKTGSVILLESYPPKPLAGAADCDGAPECSNAPDLHREIEKIIQLTYAQMNDQLSRLPAAKADRIEEQTRSQIRMCSSYRVGAFTAPVFLIRTLRHKAGIFEDWAKLFDGRFSEESMPGDTFSMLTPPNVEILAQKIDRILQH